MDWIIPKGVSVHFARLRHVEVQQQTRGAQPLIQYCKATVSTTPSSLHRNETIFPNAVSFCPERWFEPDAHQKDKYLVPFGKGMRGCLGQEYVCPFLVLVSYCQFRSLTQLC